MSHEVQSKPDNAFLRNIGLVLFALTVAVGAISVVGSLETSERLNISVEGNIAATNVELVSNSQNNQAP